MSEHLWFGPSLVQFDTWDGCGRLRGAGPRCPRCGSWPFSMLQVELVPVVEAENDVELRPDGKVVVSCTFDWEDFAPRSVRCLACGLELVDESVEAVRTCFSQT